MRSNASHDPTVKLVEEPPDVGSLVVLSPPPWDRIQLLDQLLSFKWHTPPGKGAHLLVRPDAATAGRGDPLGVGLQIIAPCRRLPCV